MIARTIFGSVLMMSVLVLPANADGKRDLQAYFSATATKVKATDDPAEKRETIHKSLQTMLKAIDIAQGSTSLSKEDGLGLDRVKGMLQEKQDELTGSNGYTRVPDAQLNAFSNYVVQDMEQAAEMVTISLVALLLIIILVVLLL